MKIKKQKIKEVIIKTFILLMFLVITWYGVSNVLSIVQEKTLRAKELSIQTIVSLLYGDLDKPQIIYKHKPVREKIYKYNEQVSKEVIINEIKSQSKEFNLGENYMINLAFCESGHNNLAKNPTSTAVGVYQYLIKTWEETESWKNHRIARTDYKANIREAMVDISNGENWRWPDCNKKITK